MALKIPVQYILIMYIKSKATYIQARNNNGKIDYVSQEAFMKLGLVNPFHEFNLSELGENWLIHATELDVLQQ